MTYADDLALRALCGLAVLGFCALLVACDDDPNVTTEPDAPSDVAADSGIDPGVDAPTADALPSDAATDSATSSTPFADQLGEMMWEPCYSNTFAGEAQSGECLRTTVPLRWGTDDGQRIEVFVKYLPAQGPVERSVWMLSGGPGFSAHGLESPGNLLASITPGTDVYLIDHRGTGNSSPLRCRGLEPTSELGSQVTQNEIGPCHEEVFDNYGDRLDAYSSTNAAYDVGALIEAIHEPEDEVFVFGISYGTYLAHRYLQLFPDQADGIIVDSMCAPDACHLNEQDRWYDRVGRELLATCTDDPACAARFDDNPYDVYAEIVADPSGACMPPGFPAQLPFLLRVIPGNLLIDDGLRMVLPAMIHRIRRCNEEDAAALAHLYGLVLGGSGGGTPPPVQEPISYSPSLAANIAISELWDRAETADDVFGAWEETAIAFGSSLQLASDWQVWTPYDDPLAGQYADTDVPLLMVQPEVDPATPLEQSLGWRDHFVAEHQHFVVVPGASHNVYLNSPLAEDLQRQCGLNLVDQFLRDPRGELDLSCVDAVRQVDFAGTPQLAEIVFGTDDLWGDE